MTADPAWYEDESSEQAGPRPFDVFDLAVMLRDGPPPPPDMICGGMLYPGCVHSISGPPESGKTTLALWWAVQILRDGGKATFIDEEGGATLTAARLAGLGATEDDVRPERFRYHPFPGRAWHDPDIVGWHAEMEREKPDFLIIDSVAVSMGNAGLDEDKTKDTIRFFRGLVQPCAREYGAAVLLIDHDTKSDDGKSRYAAGSKSKLGTIDVQYKVSAVKPFSRVESGALRLEVTKDRPGWIHPRCYRIEVSRNLDIWFASQEEMLAAEAKHKAENLSPAARKVLSCLNGNPASSSLIGRRVAEMYKMNLRRETISRSLADLAAAGLAVNANTGGQGAGDEAFWVRAPAAKNATKPDPAESPQDQLPMDRP